MDAQIRSKSLALTVVFHAVLLLLLYFLYLQTQIPPFGGGGGSASNIGLVEISSGDVQPLSENPTPEPVIEKAIPQPVAKEEKIITSEDEDAPKVEEKKENKPVKKNITPIVKPIVAKKEEKKPVTPPKPVINQNAIYKGKTNNSTSQGTGTVANGDQGTKNGDPNSLYKGNGGNGTGGGTGDGNGAGNGPGTGPGSGPGISFNLTGRKWFSPPKIDDTSQDQGKVVVAVKVDKTGNVIYAEPGARGSTTTNANLYRKAKEAALRAKFNASADGIEEQKGTITFVFVLQ